MGKKQGGIITGWQLHTIVSDSILIKETRPDIKIDKGMVFTGTVVDDPTGRWEVGFHMRSSVIIDINLESGIIETENTIYNIEGPEGDATFGNQDIGVLALNIMY